MKKTEKQFSEHLKPRLATYFKVHSFEASRNQATPDLYLVELRYGYSVWVELKIEEGGRVEFQPGQCQWLETHTKCGGLAYVIVLHPTKGGAPVISLYSSDTARWLSTSSKIAEESERRALVTAPYGVASSYDYLSLRMMQDADDKWGRG